MLRHKVPCWGYVLQEAETEGNINAELCTARGLQPGPLYKELKAGRPVTLPDGTLVRSPFLPLRNSHDDAYHLIFFDCFSSIHQKSLDHRSLAGSW